MKKLLRPAVFLASLLLLTFLCLAASAEVKISFSPAEPKMGEYVDVKVEPGREGAQSVRYSLSTPEKTVFSGEGDTHFIASFRPRQEAVYTLTATVVYGKKDEESASVTIPVSGQAPEQAGPDVLYSQKDGWWHDKVYSKTHKRSVEKSGCALFALSHALQHMGLEGEDLQPDQLATKYSRMYIANRGTDNAGLLTAAAEEYGFETHRDLVESEEELKLWFQKGSYFSFMIVIGHIALADGISEDGTKVHIIDSASGATYERIKNASVYFRAEDGSFLEAATPEEIPGCRYFFETQEYSGLEYWLDLAYCAKQGMRPIRRPWMTLNGAAVTDIEYAGALVTKVTANGETERISTRDLTWTTLGSGTPKLAVVTNKKGSPLLDGNGKKKADFNKNVTCGFMVPVLAVDKDLCYVAYKDAFGFLKREDVDLLDPFREEFRTGLISINGRTAGTSPVNVRKEPSAKARDVGSWKPGTPVAVISKEGEFYFLEGKGLRGWVHEKYLTLEGADSDGQKVDEGE